ncbi:hypothetical protein B484DRAFT_207929 [Ochromonadaceae sp. CCMP2298]|nr:hypothetical protein B484DRAFT_207929 [Ochromonadaceae sp. CCMP2298]
MRVVLPDPGLRLDYVLTLLVRDVVGRYKANVPANQGAGEVGTGERMGHRDAQLLDFPVAVLPYGPLHPRPAPLNRVEFRVELSVQRAQLQGISRASTATTAAARKASAGSELHSALEKQLLHALLHLQQLALSVDDAAHGIVSRRLCCYKGCSGSDVLAALHLHQQHVTDLEEHRLLDNAALCTQLWPLELS